MPRPAKTRAALAGTGTLLVGGNAGVNDSAVALSATPPTTKYGPLLKPGELSRSISKVKLCSPADSTSPLVVMASSGV
jgi:hypothetical protein